MCERVPDIPRFGSDAPKRPVRADLVRSQELTSVFRRCHNYIYTNAGLQKAEAFHELLKLIFCKTLDEEESSGELQFGVDPQERLNTAGQRRLLEDRITPLFQMVRERFPFIFSREEAQQADAGILHATYNVFLSTPRTAGINSRTKPIYMRQPDGQEIADEHGEKIRDDEIRGVADQFRKWLRVESSI